MHASADMPPSPERLAVHRCQVYRKSFPMTEIELPADVLKNRVVAKWVRDHRIAVDVRSGEELAVAIAAGIHPGRLTVHADAMRYSEVRATVTLGAGRVVVSSIAQIELLASVAENRTQGVVVRVTDVNAPDLAVADGRDPAQRGFRCDTAALDSAIRVILDQTRHSLVGLHCEVGSQENDFISFPAAIGHMIGEMTHIRRRHGVVLTRLGLGGGRSVPCGDWAVALRGLATEIDESLDDACATLRFPRPLVVLSPGLTIVGQSAA
jgi:diaminopimelate decarboxylase